MAADYDLTDIDMGDEGSEEESASVLDALRTELGRSITNQPLPLSVPTRPGMTVVYDTNIEATRLQMWRKKCRNKSMPDDFDGMKFSCIILANQCKQIKFGGKIVTSSDGSDLNFRNSMFLEMLKAHTTTEAVRSLYGVDGHIFVATDAVLSAAGYDSEGQELDTDPTLLD